jgi:hypothetical protein
MTITLTPEQEKTLQREAEREGKTVEQLAMEAMIAGLRNRRIPQSLDELAPRKPLPPGKTLKDIREELGPWPGDETDEELLAALKSMD